MFGILIQLIVSGIAMGFIYALVGIEYTLIWNASGVLNFSHDKMITTGAYIFGGTYILGLGMDFIPGILLSLITVALLGIVVARVIFIPLRNMTMIYTIMATVMLGKIIVEAIRLLWGPVPFSVREGGGCGHFHCQYCNYRGCCILCAGAAAFLI